MDSRSRLLALANVCFKLVETKASCKWDPECDVAVDEGCAFPPDEGVAADEVCAVFGSVSWGVFSGGDLGGEKTDVSRLAVVEKTKVDGSAFSGTGDTALDCVSDSMEVSTLPL